MFYDLRAKGYHIDLRESSDRTLLISYLYQKLVRYTDTRIRYAERFEQSSLYDEDPDHGSLVDRLPSDPSWEPPEQLSMEEEADAPRAARLPPSHESPASAFVLRLREFDNRMPRLADYLLISVSHCYRCYAKARRLAIHQRPLRTPMLANEEQIVPRPWRRFRVAARRAATPPEDGAQREFAFSCSGN
jgi:hypothetical protein